MRIVASLLIGIPAVVALGLGLDVLGQPRIVIIGAQIAAALLVAGLVYGLWPKKWPK